MKRFYAATYPFIPHIFRNIFPLFHEPLFRRSHFLITSVTAAANLHVESSCFVLWITSILERVIENSEATFLCCHCRDDHATIIFYRLMCVAH